MLASMHAQKRAYILYLPLQMHGCNLSEHTMLASMHAQKRAYILYLPLQIPGGSLPRTMDVILRSNNTDRAKPGDRMVFTGMLAVCPDIASLSGPGAVSMKPGKNLGRKPDGLVTKQLKSADLLLSCADVISISLVIWCSSCKCKGSRPTKMCHYSGLCLCASSHVHPYLQLLQRSRVLLTV